MASSKVNWKRDRVTAHREGHQTRKREGKKGEGIICITWCRGVANQASWNVKKCAHSSKETRRQKERGKRFIILYHGGVFWIRGVETGWGKKTFFMDHKGFGKSKKVPGDISNVTHEGT